MSEITWQSSPPPGNGPHVAKLRGGNTVTVRYLLRGASWSWFCTRTNRRVSPIAWSAESHGR